MMDTIRLLIIDENPEVRLAPETRLGLNPALEIVGSMGSVYDVEQKLSQMQPDVVLIEPKRLNGAGLSLIQSLKGKVGAPEVIILTSYVDDNEQLVASELGIKNYILKDIDTQALVAAIFKCRDKLDCDEDVIN